jgi:hypothetical protein
VEVSTTQAVAAGRRSARALMMDACTIRHPGTQVLNGTTGDYVVTPGDVVYDGPCRVKPYTRPPKQVEAGEQPVLEDLWIVSVPLSAVGVKPWMPMSITASGDTALVGLALTVRETKGGTTVTARRLVCEEQT